MSFVVFYLIIYCDFILFGLHSLYYNLYFSRYFHLIGYFPCCVSWFSFTLHKECLYSSCDLVLLVLKSLCLHCSFFLLCHLHQICSCSLCIYCSQNIWQFISLSSLSTFSVLLVHLMFLYILSFVYLFPNWHFLLELGQLCTPMPFVVFFLIRPHSLETNS